MGYFRRTRLGIKISLDPVEAAVLEQVISEMSDVIGEPPELPGGEQWVRDLGLAGVGVDDATLDEDPRELPDPIRSRLFPAAYRGDDDVDGAARDFRRFTEDDLRAGKAANARALLASLPSDVGSAAGRAIVLDSDACAAWLGALNDARLALGTALEVDENTEYALAALEPSDPQAQRLLVYHWLGELQSSLLDALMR